MDLLTEILIYVGIGLITGVINTLAGGGSLLTLPLLIFNGMEPSLANGTNKIGVLFQSLFANLGFKSRQVKTFPFELHLSLPAVVGSIIGSQIAIEIKAEIFNKILVVVMVFVVMMIITNPKTSTANDQERLTGKPFWIAMIIFFFIGIYGGFIQAGIGYFMMFSLSLVNRISLIKINAIKAFTVTIFTISSLAIFLFNGKVNWKYGLLLALGSATSSWLTSRWSVKKGEGVIKVFLVITVIAMGIKLWFF